MTRDATGDALASRVRSWVTGAIAATPPEPFDPLACDIFAYQADRDPVASALLTRPVRTWADIPAVPVGLYKQVRVGTVHSGGVVFRTSGTTHGGRGAHHMASTDLYDHGALTWARHCLGALPGDIVALLQDPMTAPDSSLAHMVAAFRALAGDGHTSWHLADGVLNHASLNTRLSGTHNPVFLAATAFALAEWLATDPNPLPAGSVCMVTGGFKGRTTDLDQDALLIATGARLGCQVVTEYGMTELSSQLWGSPGAPYRPPPWLRVTAADPVTGVDLPAGTPGQLRFLDLCNLDGAVRIETLDEGVVHPDGEVTLHGRLSGAEARGCSLPVEEAWAQR